MSIRVPTDTNGRWTQPNSSDKLGAIWFSKGINLDERGYLKQSPRMVRLYSDDNDNDFGFPMAIGRMGPGQYQVATDANNWGVDIDANEKSIDKDTGSQEPTPGFDGDGAWFQGLWHVSTSTAVRSRPASGGNSQAWTPRLSGFTSGFQHRLAVFKSRVSLCVSNGNVLKQYDSSYSNTTDLTIPSDFEIVGLAYNNSRMGIITRLQNDGSLGQDQEAMFFLWDGAGTGANGDAGLGSDAGVAICPYKSSFAVLTRAGELLAWNGGGFGKPLAVFPFYFTNQVFGEVDANNVLGNVYMRAEGERIFINIGIQIDDYGSKEENRPENMPSGAWCYDPEVGLYHRTSPSASDVHVNHVDCANDVNLSTNVFTASTTPTVPAVNLPATGSPIVLTQNLTGEVGGIEKNHVYYLIKESSTTFKLAATREEAFEGVAIDITSASGDAFFWMLDIVDYGNSFYRSPGDIASVGDRSNVYTDFIMGARLAEIDDLSGNESLCISVPFFENRNYFVTPKIFPREIQDMAQGFFMKFRPLKDSDTIVVKYRKKDVLGLPISSASNGEAANWTGASEFYTTMDLSEAKTYLDAGGELEIEFTNGAGAGVMTQITRIEEGDDGTYSLELDDDVVGATNGRKAHFVIQNWEIKKTITSEANDDGFAEVSVDQSGKFHQFKIELRGSDITIEEWQLVSKEYQPAQ